MESASHSSLFEVIMSVNYSKLSAALGILVTGLFFIQSAFGQNRRNEPLPKSIQEKLVEMKIDEEKKDFDKLLERSEMVAKLSEDIETSFHENKKLTSEDKKRLEEVEDLLGKIRKELRASKDDDDEKEEAPHSILTAIENLRENTSKLFEEVKKTTRHTISAVAVQSSNTVLNIVKFLRFDKD